MADEYESFEKFAAKQIKEDLVATTVGRATISWNTLSQSVFYLFQTLSGLEYEAAKHVFFVVKSDRSQRDMAAELISHVLKPLDEKLAKRAMALIGQANKLAGQRNDVLHVIFINTESPEETELFHKIGHLKGDKGTSIIEKIHALTIECMKLAGEFLKIATEAMPLFVPSHSALPGRGILEYIAQLNNPEQANQMEYGLPEPVATNEQTPSANEDQSQQSQ